MCIYFIQGITVHDANGYTILTTPRVGIIWNNVYNVRLVLRDHYYFNQTSGMCGTFNGIQSDDFLTPFGTIVMDPVEFGNSWNVDPECNKANPVPHPCDGDREIRRIAEENCTTLRSFPFSQCAEHLNVERYILNCEYDMCACQDNPAVCYCQVVDAYAADCARHVDNINWRDLDQFALCSE